MGNQSGPVWRREVSGPQCREDVLTYARIVDKICDLAQLLESVNLSAWAIRLVDAVDGASTGRDYDGCPLGSARTNACRETVAGQDQIDLSTIGQRDWHHWLVD